MNRLITFQQAMLEALDAVVLDELPSTAKQVSECLCLAHEATYAALVRLYDQGRAEILMRYDQDNPSQPRIWWEPID